MKGDNSITYSGVVLTFKSVKVQWLVKEILVFWSIGYIRFIGDDSEHKVDDSDDGWMLDSEEFGQEESEIVSESDCKTAMFTVEMCALWSSFTRPTPALLLLAPILLGLGEATHSELLGTKRVNQFSWYEIMVGNAMFQDQPKLSPLPQVRPHKSSPRRVSNKHEVYISPHRTTVTKTTPKGMSYCINKSPARVRQWAEHEQRILSMTLFSDIADISSF